MPGSRRVAATVWFCDLVGSTAQRAALGDEAADHFALPLNTMLLDIVHANRVTPIWAGRVRASWASVLASRAREGDVADDSLAAAQQFDASKVERRARTALSRVF